MSGSRHVTLLSGVVAAALMGTWLGFLDFFLFELQGNRAGFREYVLYKPSLFGLSLLSSQLLSFVTLGIFCFCFLTLVWLILGKPVGKRESLPALPLFAVIFTIGIISLRFGSFLRGVERINHRPLSPGLLLTLFGGDLRQVYSFVILITGSAVLVAYANVLHRSQVGATGALVARLSLSPRSQFFVLFLLVGASLCSPDAYSAYLRFPFASEKQQGKAPNVLFIVLDTVRADHLSCYGYEKRTTPNIDRIAQEGVVFSNAFSAAPWTLPSHASMFTGLYPSQHQADHGHYYLDESFPTLAEQLGKAGYQTVGFSENPSVGRFGRLARGFGEFHETWRRPLVVRAIAKVAIWSFHYKDRLEYAERSIGLFERWLSNNKPGGKPFFAFFNFMAAHGPRYPRPGFGPENWNNESLARIEPVNLNPARYYLPQFKLNQQELQIMADVYDSNIAYLDSQIGDLISYLETEGILGETILILTSDHGENFGEHGLFEHQFCLYNTLLHVPLILRYPAMWEHKRIEKRVSTVFLFKTVLALAGTSQRSGPEKAPMDPLAQLEGQNFLVAEYSSGVDEYKGLLGTEGRGFNFSLLDKNLKCVIEGDLKFIWSSNGKHELYRMKEDFGEVENLIEKEQAQARALDDLLRSWESSTPRRPLL
jgi:arylsulfatase A-like enzyme